MTGIGFLETGGSGATSEGGSHENHPTLDPFTSLFFFFFFLRQAGRANG